MAMSRHGAGGVLHSSISSCLREAPVLKMVLTLQVPAKGSLSVTIVMHLVYVLPVRYPYSEPVSFFWTIARITMGLPFVALVGVVGSLVCDVIPVRSQ